MISSFRYAAINSKLKVRKRIFLDQKDYEAVLELTTISEMTNFLKQRVDFKEGFQGVSSTYTHRGDLEVILHRYVVAEIEKIIHYFSGPHRAFFKTLLMEYEILDLQLILQSIAKGEDLLPIKDHFIHSNKYSKLDYEALLNAKTVPQFVESLKGSLFYNSLKTLTQGDATHREFHMEMKLYLLYYQELMKKVKQLDLPDREIAQDIIGTIIDNINIQWIYRATKYYKISPEEILIYVLLDGKKLNYLKLKALCYANTMEEFKVMAEKQLRYRVFKEENDIFLETTIDRLLHSFYRTQKGDKNIGVCLVYLYDLKLQIKDLVSITECIRYGYTAEEKKKYLIRIH